MAKVVWPQSVVAQLNEITAYIARDDPTAADRIARRLIALGESLSVFPNCGSPASGGARVMSGVPPYLLRYRLIDDIVVIIDIRHGRRLPPS